MFITFNNKKYSVTYIENVLKNIENIFNKIRDDITYINKEYSHWYNFAKRNIESCIIQRNSAKINIISLFGKDCFNYKVGDGNINNIFDMFDFAKVDLYLDNYLDNNMYEYKSDYAEFGYVISQNWQYEFYLIIYDRKFKSLYSKTEFFRKFLKDVFRSIMFMINLENYIRDVFLNNDLSHLDQALRNKILLFRNKLNELYNLVDTNSGLFKDYLDNKYPLIKDIIDKLRIELKIYNEERFNSMYTDMVNHVSTMPMNDYLSITNQIKNIITEIRNLYNDIFGITVNGVNTRLIKYIDAYMKEVFMLYSSY